MNGATAQEEALCQVSNLYHALRDFSLLNDVYGNGKGLESGRWAIYSSGVSIFRDGDGDRLDEAVAISVLSAPAVNHWDLPVAKEPVDFEAKDGTTKKVFKYLVTREEEAKEMEDRIDRVLNAAVYHQEEVLVLGAWGCGVFGQKADTIAKLFKQALDSKYKDRFRTVVFAIYDNSRDGENVGPFFKEFYR